MSVAIIIGALKAIGLQLIAVTGAKWALERSLFVVAKMIVKSTKTPHDDEWLADLEKRYFSYKK